MARRSETVLVTGASGGIGLELARTFAANGHDVILVARSEQALKSLADELHRAHGVEASVITADLSEPDGVAELVREIEAEGLSVDILVNNAGVGLHGSFLETGLDDEMRMLHLNVVALTELTKRLVPPMVARGKGRVLNLGSTAGFLPGPLMAVYYATKAYVISFSEALERELAGTGVSVTVLCPGVTRSGFQDRAGVSDIRLTRGPLSMDAQTVAKAGYRATMRGRRMVIPGFVNKAYVQSLRFSPRTLPPRIVAFMHRKVGG